MVDKSEANCRQVFHRARQRLAERQARYEASEEQREQVTEQFMHAATTGDVQGLLRVLADDVVLIGDGGGKGFAAPQPIHSADRVSRGFLGALQKMPPDRAWIDEVNGQPAIVATRGGKAFAVLLLEVRAGRVQRMYSVVNPDKLRDFERRLQK
jgi:RNA polymerase sigma-70 factor (ECF subfamily)